LKRFQNIQIVFSLLNSGLNLGLSLGVTTLAVPSISWAATVADFRGSVEITPTKSYSRFSIAIDSSFKPEITETAQGFLITIPAATLMDVGVPFGSEEAYNQYLSGLTDTRISSIKVHEEPGKLVVEGKYKFPIGSAKLADPKMDHFDFRKNEEGKYYVDFFYKKGPTAIEANRDRRSADDKKLQAERELFLKKEAERKESREKRLIEARNALFFCDLPFDRANTIFLKYRADHPVVKFSAYFPEKIPDHLFEYTEPKGASEEVEMVRLALKLARENKEALSMKTIEFLEKQYPKSRFTNEMLFLKANDLYRLGFEDKGRELLVQISKRARGTDVSMQSSAFLAVQAFKNQEWLAALEGFMNLKREMPKSKLAWLFRYGIAESLYQIKQTDQAKLEYEWVAANAPKADIRAEAAFKAGDVYFDRNQFAQAIVVYESSTKKHEGELIHYPQVLMNLAESYFQLDEFARAEKIFAKYLEIGRNQPNAWRASLRLAEIKSLHQKMTPEIETAFTDTVNSYPMSPGAVIARLRMLPCGTHGGFDLGSAQRLINSPEVKNFDGERIMYTEPFKELVAVTEVRTLLSFGQDEASVKAGLARLRDNPSMDARRFIEQAMIGGIKRVLEKQLNTGDEIGAIASYQKYGDYLPLPLHDPMADDLKMRLAKVASDRKLTSLALKIIEPYQKLSQVEAKELMAAIRKNLVNEGVDDTESRTFLEVKTLWNGANFKAEDEKQANDLLARLSTIREQSKFSLERDLILALYYAEIKDFAKANELNLQLTTRMAKVDSGERIQIWTFAGETANSAQDYAYAAKSFHQARVILEKVSKDNHSEIDLRRLGTIPSLSYLYQNEGETLEKQQKWKEAVALYTEAIENKVGGNHILYAHAKALLQTGGRESKKIASRSLEKIEQSQDDDVWKRLAREKLNEIAKEGRVDEKRNP
jgi:predicted Zn-dependent protease